MKAVKWTSRSRDLVAAAPLSHQRPTIYIWTICKRHIVTSWVVCVPHMKWIGQKGTEPWSGNGKTFKRPVGHWLLTQKWCATHRHLMGCLCTTYEVNQSKRNGATEQTRQNLPTTRVTLTFVFLTQKWCATPDHYISTAQVGYAQRTAHVRAANNAILWRMVGVFIYNAWAAYMPNLYICLILTYIQSKTRWDCCS